MMDFDSVSLLKFCILSFSNSSQTDPNRIETI